MPDCLPARAPRVVAAPPPAPTSTSATSCLSTRRSPRGGWCMRRGLGLDWLPRRHTHVAGHHLLDDCPLDTRQGASPNQLPCAWPRPPTRFCRVIGVNAEHWEVELSTKSSDLQVGGAAQLGAAGPCTLCGTRRQQRQACKHTCAHVGGCSICTASQWCVHTAAGGRLLAAGCPGTVQTSLPLRLLAPCASERAAVGARVPGPRRQVVSWGDK